MDMKRGFGVIIGRLYPFLEHPLKRIRQEWALMQTPGIELRIPTDTDTLLIFDRLADAVTCREAMWESRNPVSETILSLEYSYAERGVRIRGEIKEKDLRTE